MIHITKYNILPPHTHIHVHGQAHFQIHCKKQLQGCQLWMRVRREICQARPLAAYKCRAKSQKNWWAGGGNSVTFFLNLKKQPFSHSRHIQGYPSYITNLWQAKKKKKKNCVRYFHNYMRESVRVRWNGVKCVSLTLNAWELAALTTGTQIPVVSQIMNQS